MKAPGRQTDMYNTSHRKTLGAETTHQMVIPIEVTDNTRQWMRQTQTRQVKKWKQGASFRNRTHPYKYKNQELRTKESRVYELWRQKHLKDLKGHLSIGS